MKIEIIPNVLSLEEISILMSEVNPKVSAQDMTYFSNVEKKYGTKKVKCTDHLIVKLAL